MSAPLTGQDIINKFHLYTGDQTEMSTEDELDLANNKYDGILSNRPWNFLKTSAVGNLTPSVDAQGNQIAVLTLPDDFSMFIENNEKTDNASTTYNNASQKVVFVGPNYTPYQIVNWSDRRQFRGSSGFCYPDLANNQLVFTSLPPDLSYEFDYIKTWDAITLTTSPVFPARFHNMIYQLMAVDSVIIELFDRSHSYAKENQQGADELLSQMKYWDSMQTFN